MRVLLSTPGIWFLGIWFLSIWFLAGNVAADPIEWPVSQGGNGHYYEAVGGRGTPYEGVTWNEADEAAKSMSYLGQSGHLVTLANLTEYSFLRYLPVVPCNIVGGEGCDPFHIGGWALVTAVIDPRPYNPPYVETTAAQWITGETGDMAVLPNSFVDGPVGAVLYFKWGIFSMDGIGYPDYGPHAVNGPSTAHGFIVEYDGLTPISYPEGTVSTSLMSWSNIKALYR